MKIDSALLVSGLDLDLAADHGRLFLYKTCCARCFFSGFGMHGVSLFAGMLFYLL